MNITTMHLGMKVRHPKYGIGEVKSLAGQLAEITFPDGTQRVAPEACGLEPAEPQADLTGLTVPLQHLIEETVRALAVEMGIERDDAIVEQLAARWAQGRLVLHPSDPTLQTKEVPLDVLFHKIVMMRNNLRTMEQKINAHEKLSEADKIELQQYLTRCYGSMTTFNVLFRRKEDQFSGTTS